MKFIAALTTLIALFPSALGQTLFGIDGGDFTGTSWNVDNAGTNSVDITFNLQGENTADFNVGVAECGADVDDYTLSPTTAPDGNTLTLTFTNSIPIVETTFCAAVSLFVDGISAAVATKTFEYTVTVTNGVGNVEVTATPGASGVASNALGNGGEAASGTLTFNWSPVYSPSGAIKFGQDITITLAVYTGFEVDIGSVTGGTMTSTAGYVAAPTAKTATIKFPLSAFLDSQTTINLGFTVSWKPIGTRLLRAMQEEDYSEYPQQGSTDYTLAVDIVPLEDGSFAYTTSIVSVSSIAAAGAVALFL